MLNHREIGKLPPLIRLSRNGRSFEARRAEIGSIDVKDGQIRIADAEWVDQVPALPIRVPCGTHAAYAYQWLHRIDPINVCVVFAFSLEQAVKSRQLRIETDIRPDLTDGIIVDTAKVAMQSSTQLTLTSGLGDGYYPIMANYDMHSEVQSLVVDFKVWKVSSYILAPGQRLDEFGMVETVENLPEDPVETARINASYRQMTLNRVAAEIVSGARFQSGPPCPSCGKPLRTAKARQCFLCGYRADRNATT